MITLVLEILYAIIDAIVSLLFRGCLWVAKAIMDSSITVFTENENILAAFVRLLPINKKTPIHPIISGIAIGLIILLTVISLIKSFADPLIAKPSESPLNALFRTFCAILLYDLLFGTGLTKWDGLLAQLGRWFGLILSPLSQATEIGEMEWFMSMSSNPAASIGFLVLFCCLLGAVVGAAITYLERILSFAVYVLVGPIAIATFSSKETEQVGKQWISGLFSQFLAILLSLFLWGLFLNQLSSMGAFLDVNQVGKEAQAAKMIFQTATAIGLLSLVKNSEKILNAFGIHTMFNGEAARSLRGGIGLLLGAKRELGKGVAAVRAAGRDIKTAAGTLSHAPSPLMRSNGGGRSGGGISGRIPNTGNARLYDSSGNLNLHSTGNFFRRTMARINGGGVSFRGFGSKSVAAKQAIQQQSVTSLRNAMTSSTGAAVKSSSLYNTATGFKTHNSRRLQSYTGAQITNMALSGSEYGRNLHFTGAAGTSDMFVASGTAMNGNYVKGVAGNAEVLNPRSGALEGKGTYFLPVENGGAENELAIGTQVDIGDGKDWFVSGDSFLIDEFGAKAYQISSPDELTQGNGAPA